MNQDENRETSLINRAVVLQGIDVDTMALQATNVMELADRLERYFQENNPLAETNTSPYDDILRYALGRVEWQYLAEIYWEDARRTKA